MGNVPNPANGIKAFFVGEMNNRNTLGSNGLSCMVLSKDADEVTLAHETGHYCDLRDIYISQPGFSIANAGVVQASYFDPKDWGAGYYEEGLMHTNLIKRLLMYGIRHDDRGHVPHGHVRGVFRPTRTNDYQVGMAPIGLDAPLLKRNPPKHAP